MAQILIVDDEKNIRSTLARSLRLEGFATLEAENGKEALDRLEAEEVDLVILDLQMPVMDGMELLDEMKRRGMKSPAIVLTAHGTIERAVAAVRLGAHDLIEKPPAAERILLAVENALRLDSLEAENRRLAEEAGLGVGLLGESPAMKALGATIARVAPTSEGVLLLGENGTGKELVARAIHEQGPRRTRPLVTVNCAAIPETLFESELFGHARGSFTGATEARRGKFQLADRGTIFLDEVGEIPPALQPKLLRALESGEVERVGGREVERTDVRVIAATNRDLETEVRSGRFRRDLDDRLLVVPIRIPPLRERAEDVPLLARHYLDAACRRNSLRAKRLSEGALAVLVRHAWPGNVRELRNAMGRVAILVPDEVVRPDHLDFLTDAAGAEGLGASASGSAAATLGPPSPGGPAGEGAPTDLASALQQYERAFVLQVLERCRWRMSKAAQVLGLERSHLYKKLKVLGIERPAED
jgi:two-component system nitrogen regulation response regulator NtrX